LDLFAIGEHHRPDFLVSSPAVVLAAIAARTKRIRLSSAVSVLSSDDPVRVFQQFAELDLLSGGRAEIMAQLSPKPFATTSPQWKSLQMIRGWLLSHPALSIDNPRNYGGIPGPNG